MNVGGTARYIELLLENLPNNRLATGYVQGSEKEDPCVETFKTIRIPHMGRRISPIHDLYAWLELKKVIKELQPVVVHTHTFKAGVLGRFISGKHKRVHTYHGHLFDDDSFSKIQKRLITFTEKFLARRTDLLISVGKEVGSQLRAQGIGPNQKWLSIPPGVRSVSIISRDLARKNLGLDSQGILIGWMARMAEVKNPFMFLEVAKELKDLNFVMAGGGELLNDIQKIAPSNVKVIGWADANIFWSAVNLGVSTSHNEGMPVALIEAQLAGVPIVATDVGSSAEVVENEVTGFVTAKKLEEMVSLIRMLAGNKELLDSMGAAAKKRATSEFNPSKMVTSHQAAYSNLFRVSED